MLDVNRQKSILLSAINGLKAQGTVQLTGSKSESNRALLLQSLSGGGIQVKNLSEANDTTLMQQALAQTPHHAENTQHQPVTIDVGPAGTVMRFMTALLAISPGRYILTGSERMQQRPISVLTDALQQLGANITYLGHTGFPPLAINGSFKQRSTRISVPGHISSQYLSALLLIAPALPLGLTLQITGMLTSKPYLTMTLDMLTAAGIHYTYQDNIITIAPQAFRPTTLEIEPDWSAASYWYSLLALANEGQQLFLPGLKENSLQGDRVIAELMKRFGVQTTFLPEGIQLEKTQVSPSSKHAANDLIDCTSCPDLAQTLVVCAAALQQDLRFTGLHTLRIKETDRIAALQTEIAKFGVQLVEDGDTYQLKTAGFFHPESLTIDTYEDHRMAMAFAPLALIFDTIRINDPGVVDKSYPHFYTHLSSMGFLLDSGQ